ncbi:MAG: FKBP-type peptidyl-prolyl cis-trans isomerase [Akkermansiaceae bacterium]
MSKTPKTPEDVAAAPADAEVTDSGLASKILKPGSGTGKPGSRDTVEVHYSGWTTDGKLFDSSEARGEKISFPLDGVISGWTEGLQHMVVGEKRRFWIPADLAYGEKPSRPGAPCGNLTFDVELFSIKGAPQSPKIPEDLIATESAEKSPSGLASQVLEEGEGEGRPGPTDIVEAHFTGWLENGDLLESTVMNGKPAQFKLDQVSIKGWVEGLQLMRKGEKRRFWIPEALGFGENPPQGAPKGNLIFDFELLEFNEMPKSPESIPAPDDVSAAPADAEPTGSGLASKVLLSGAGNDHPAPTDEVLVHYTGWTTDGKMFDSSVARGEPISFPLNGVIKGWTEGVQLMVVGEKRRFWIPGNLAYGETPSRPGAPSGTLVFDVELIKIGD